MGGYQGAAAGDFALYCGNASNSAQPTAAFLVLDVEYGVTTILSNYANVSLGISDVPVLAVRNLTTFDVSTIASSNFQFFGQQAEAAYGGAVGAVLVNKASTNPSSSSSVGSILYADSSSGGLCVYAPGDTSTTGPTLAITQGQLQGGAGQAGFTISAGASVAATPGVPMYITGQQSSYAGGVGGLIAITSGAATTLGTSGGLTVATGAAKYGGTLTLSTGGGTTAGTIAMSPGGTNVISVGSLGSGVGVLQIANATTQPSGTPSNSVYLTSNAGKAQIYDSNGTSVTLSGLGITFSGGTAHTVITAPSIAGSATSLELTGQAATAATNGGGGVVITGGSSGGGVGGLVNMISGQGASVNGTMTLSTGVATTYGALGTVSSGNTPGAWTWKGAALTQTQAVGGGGKSTLNVATGSFLFMPVTINGAACQIVLCV